MLSKAEAKYIRMSPTKVRLVLGLVKGKTVEKANFILDSMNKRAARPIKKVVNSAFSNVNQGKTQQEKVLSKDVVISKAKADGGPFLQRYRAATMGRATPVRHRTVHIYVELDKIAEKKKKVRKTSDKAKKTNKKSGEK